MNFITARRTMRLISGEKDWKHVSMQKVVTLNTYCDIACLTFQLPPTFERTQQTFRQMKKFCISQVSVVTFLVGVSK